MNRERREVIKVLFFAFCVFVIMLIFSRFIKKLIEERLFENMVRWMEK